MTISQTEASSQIHSRNRTIRALALMMSDFGSSGGIAEYSRGVLTALSENPDVLEVYSLSRYRSSDGAGDIPDRLCRAEPQGRSRFSYLKALWQLLVRQVFFKQQRFDIICCGHLHLLPVALFVKLFTKARVVVFLYGIEAWNPPKRAFLRSLVTWADAYIACSAFTQDRFCEWAHLPTSIDCFVLPGKVDRVRFHPGPKNDALMQELGIENQKVLFTLARLNPEEQYKGIDEVLEVLPRLIKEQPNLVYMVGGDGTDRDRLINKAGELGIEEHVLFLGFVPEALKPDYYRLADLFVMPGRGEGFGIVYLEALASGVPVVGSILDASQETLLNGKLGILANPDDPEELLDALRQGLVQRVPRPEMLEEYSTEKFQKRFETIVEQIVKSMAERC